MIGEIVQVISETIKTMGAGQIPQSAVPIDPKTRKDAIRCVPAEGTHPQVEYTVELTGPEAEPDAYPRRLRVCRSKQQNT